MNDKDKLGTKPVHIVQLRMPVDLYRKVMDRSRNNYRSLHLEILKILMDVTAKEK